MRCRDTAQLWIDLETGTASPGRREELDAHLTRCPACAGLVSIERALSRDLRALGELPAPRIDVSARVLAALPGREEWTRDAWTPAQLGWTGAALTGSAAALVVGALWMLPRLTSLGAEARALVSGLRGLADATATAVSSLAAAGGKAAARLAEGLTPLAATLEQLEPLALVSLAGCSAVMAAMIAFVVGRDLLGHEKGTLR